MAVSAVSTRVQRFDSNQPDGTHRTFPGQCELLPFTLLGHFRLTKMSTVVPPRPKQGSSQCDASSAQREPPLLVPVSEDPACREVCDGVIAPSDDPISDGRRCPEENPDSNASSVGEATESSDDVVIVRWSRGSLQRRSSARRRTQRRLRSPQCPEENPDSNASSVGEATESSDDVVIVRWSRGSLQRRSKLKNFIVPVKIEEPWDSGYLASYHRGALQATTGTPCQGTSKGAETTSSRNKRTVKTKQKACSAVLTCTRIPKVPGERTPKKPRRQGRKRAAKGGAAGCEKKTAVDCAVEQFEPTVIKKLKAIESTSKAPMPPPKPHAAATTKSKPRGRKKKQEIVPAVGTEVRRGSAGAEATPRFSETVVRRVKNGENTGPVTQGTDPSTIDIRASPALVTKRENSGSGSDCLSV
ncbi:hypothetical protein MRX96_007974 [Rhipicephalus microplus]